MVVKVPRQRHLLCLFTRLYLPGFTKVQTPIHVCSMYQEKSRPRNSWSTRQSRCTHKETARFHYNCQPATWASICGMILARASSSIFENEIYS